MNLLLLQPAELDGDRVTLRGRRARHLHEVLRVKPGSTVRAGIVRGGVGTATVTTSSPDVAELCVTISAAPVQPPRVDLVLAMPRPKELSRILQTAASFGVARIDITNAWRVDKSYLQSTRLDPERLREDLLVGCEQGSTTWLPDVAVHPRLMPLLDDVLVPRLANAAGIIAHPYAEHHVEQVAGTPIVVAIGPEGGWIQRELDTFVDRGFVGVSLGKRILRTHAAVAGLFAQLDMLGRLRARG